MSDNITGGRRMNDRKANSSKASGRNMYYECKYTPVELIEAFGGEPELLNRSSETFRQAEILGSPNLCGFGKSVIETAIGEHIKDLFLVNCCDTIRSASDIIADAGDTEFLYTMDLPHCMSQCSRELMTAHLEDFATKYGERTGLSFDPARFRRAFTTVERPGGPYIAVLGARMSDELFEVVENTMPLPCRNLSCVRGRDLGAARPPETDDFHRLMDWYAWGAPGPDAVHAHGGRHRPEEALQRPRPRRCRLPHHQVLRLLQLRVLPDQGRPRCTDAEDRD